MTTDARRGSRLRLVSLLAPPVIAVALFIVWAQPWIVLTLDDGVRIAAGGDRAAAVLPAIAVASLALTSALALASARIRPVLGALLALLGALVVAVSLRAAGDPVAAAASSVTQLTGVEGERSVRALVDTAALTAGPVSAIVLGAVLGVAGLAIAVTSRRWPRRVERFDRPEGPSPEGSAADGTATYSAPSAPSDAGDASDRQRDQSIGDWDALSDGRDPTTR
ncbi:MULTISPECIES: Trp biosynthesis-associated membrane protein [Microcella]|uniref:Trp biosynthesis-associated membrane protein n=1 Tax=Microcella TaxID=337004 RepID=UPI0015CF7893|nr:MULTISPECIES: Trp biosynthesis-associated membrane protein [Microcella]QOD92579.1 Trp biosynthesis-associated membrane protein [Chryseoglobus sp. 28M-23]